MKISSLIFFSFLFIHSIISQEVYSTTEGGPIHWGSTSFGGPNWGFYGQEIKLTKASEISSVSVYIYDHKDHDETKSQINFAVWSCEDKPSSEMYLSPAQAIRKEQVGAWFEYEFPDPLLLDPGTYLFAVGQATVQGFVAFGGQKRKADYTGREWMKIPLPGISDGKKWITFRDIAELVAAAGPEEEFDLDELESSALMMKIKYSE